jgi:hypothetical protein
MGCEVFTRNDTAGCSLKPVPEKTRPHGFEQKQGNAIWFANL